MVYERIGDESIFFHCLRSLKEVEMSAYRKNLSALALLRLCPLLQQVYDGILMVPEHYFHHTVLQHHLSIFQLEQL